MIITNTTIAALLEAEGSFYVGIQINSRNYLAVQFQFVVLTQKDLEVIQACANFLQTTTNILIPKPRWTNGSYNLTLTNSNEIIFIGKLLVNSTPLISSKWMDSTLFFKLYSIYRNHNLSRPVRLLYVAHFMFAMNWQGQNRKHSLQTYEVIIEKLFQNPKEFLQCKRKVLKDLSTILNRGYPSLQNHLVNVEEYFIGLYVGDGTAFVYFKFRPNSKPNLYKEFSISLKKHQQNLKLFRFIGKSLGFQWKEVKADKTRCRVKLSDNTTINNIIQPLLEKYKEYLPVFKKKQLLSYKKYDEIQQYLNKPVLSNLEKKKLKSNLIFIYFCSEKGKYRKHSLEHVLKSFGFDEIKCEKATKFALYR